MEGFQGVYKLLLELKSVYPLRREHSLSFVEFSFPGVIGMSDIDLLESLKDRLQENPTLWIIYQEYRGVLSWRRGKES